MTDIREDALHLVDPDLLPPQIRRLVNCIGVPGTFRLLEARGGTPLRVPLVPARAEVLAEYLEPQELAALCAELGGQMLELPKVDKMLIQIRNHAIREARKHMSAAETARAFNLTRRMVIYIGQEEAEQEQADLFS